MGVGPDLGVGVASTLTLYTLTSSFNGTLNLLQSGKVFESFLGKICFNPKQKGKKYYKKFFSNGNIRKMHRL